MLPGTVLPGTVLPGTVLAGYGCNVRDAFEAALPTIAAGRMRRSCLTFERFHQRLVSRVLPGPTAMRVFSPECRISDQRFEQAVQASR